MVTLKWQVSLGCLFTLLTWTQSTTASSHEHVMVVRSTDDNPAFINNELYADEPLEPITLTEMDVNSKISMRYAYTEVLAYMRNPSRRAQEATFRLLLPETAFISSFTMTLNGKDYKAYVEGKEEAKQIYNEGVSQGRGAAHIAAKARDSNHFTVSVNVEPQTYAVFNLTYEELLIRRNGVYNHAINLHPGDLVPKLLVTVHIKESQKITVLRVPELRTGNEVEATETDPQNSKTVILKHHDDHEATIIFRPDLDEQRRLLEIYAQKSQDSRSHANKWSHGIADDSAPGGVLGQFVVQYDVDRSVESEMLVNDGYFVQYFVPSAVPTLSKYVIFVLDTSGSMYVRKKIEQLQAAMKSILSELNPGDYFNIVEFASGVMVHDLSESDRERQPKSTITWYHGRSQRITLVTPSQATYENIDKAKTIIDRLDAAGGTNIDSALSTAVDLANNDFDSLNRYGFKNLERIIIFLTDGEATVGETNPERIINRFIAKNSGEHKASLFTLALGELADREFLRKLSVSNNGHMRHIYEASDVALQLRRFYRQVSSPLLSDIVFTYPDNQVIEDTVTKRSFSIFYAGTEMVVAGKITQWTSVFTSTITASRGYDNGFARSPYRKSQRIRVRQAEDENLSLERLWAYLTIKQLLDEKDVHDVTGKDPNEANSPKQKALRLALQYGFVTPLTSLVVVKPDDTNAVDLVSVDESGHGVFPIRAPTAPSTASSEHGMLIPHSPPAYGLPGVKGERGDPGVYGLSHPHSSSAYGGPGQKGDYGYPMSIPNSPPAYESHGEKGDTDDDRVYAMYIPYDPNVHGLKGERGLSGLPGHIPRPAPVTTTPSPVYDLPAPAYSPGYDVSQTAYNLPPPAYDFPRPAERPARPSGERGYPSNSNSKSHLADYHLENYPWTALLLNHLSDELQLRVNGVTLHLKLTKGTVAPKLRSGDATCPRATDGFTGSCVYITRCDAAKRITQEVYANIYCTINGEYAGVCCPREDIDDD